MIPKRAISAYLDRPRKDWRFLKRLDLDKLERWQESLPIRPPIWNSLRKHQKVCVLLGAMLGRFAFFVDTGGGKSFISIALIRYFFRLGALKGKRTLILVPNKINKGEWARMFNKHSPITEYCVLQGSSIHKWQQLRETKALAVVETYAGLVRMICVMGKTKKGKNKLKPDPKLVRELLKLFGGLIMDESTVVKRKGVLAYRICRQISKQSVFTFALAGIPFGRDPVDLWSQLYLIDKGETLGETLGLYRAAFFDARDLPFGGVKYTFKPKMRPVLNQLLANRSIRYLAAEADLPKLVLLPKHVHLPEDAQTYYDRARSAVIDAHGNYQEMKNGFMKMRQISSGWLGYRDDEVGTRAEFEFTPNPKLEALLSTIEFIPPEDKVLVFHDFIFSGSIICRELDRMGIKYVRLHRKVKDPAPLLDTFDNDPDCQVFVLSTAGGFGLNLQIAKYGLFFESPLSVIMRKQMIRRFERQYSTHKTVFLMDFIVEGTVDQQILDMHEQGKTLFEAIVEGSVRPL